MIVIADSNTRRTHWAIVDGTTVVDKATTSGINPFFQTRREISHIIRLELPEAFFRRRWERVYFYGSGCALADKVKKVDQSVVAQFRSPAVVDSDLTGAARGMLVHSPGIACIISTGSNSCFYDGERVVKNVRPGGYILGDEGSLGSMGRRLVSDVLKEIAPARVVSGFYDAFSTNADEVMNLVYSHPHASSTLARYAIYLSEIIGDEYAHDVVCDAFRDYFDRCISFYDFKRYALSVKVSDSFPFEVQFREVAAAYGARVDKIVPSIMEGLISYHHA